MIAVSVRHPWAEAIVRGKKDMEVRGYDPRIRPRTLVAIQASRTVDHMAPEEVWDAAFGETRERVEDRSGGIIGVVKMGRVVRIHTRRTWKALAPRHLGPLDWWQPNRSIYVWEMLEAVCLEVMIPCRGQLRAWSLTDSVGHEVLQAYRAAKKEAK